MAAERRYPTSKVRSGGGEEIPHVQGLEWLLHFAGPAVWRYPTSKVRETPIGPVGTGAAVRRYPMSKGKGEAPAGGQEGRIRVQNQIPFPPEMFRGLKQTLRAPGPRDPTETETEL